MFLPSFSILRLQRYLFQISSVIELQVKQEFEAREVLAKGEEIPPIGMRQPEVGEARLEVPQEDGQNYEEKPLSESAQELLQLRSKNQY